MKPGIYPDMPFAEYLAIPALSNSTAKLGLSKSWRHAREAMLGDLAPEESTVFDIGTAAHAMLLERSADGLAVIDAEDWRTKAAKEARDAARSAGKTPILARHFAKVHVMVSEAHAFLAGTEYAGVLNNGQTEVTLVWEDIGGVLCKARLDCLSADGRVILDYKTTDNASPEAFGRSIANYGYDFQSRWYRRGLHALTAANAQFVLLAQETMNLHLCSMHALSNAYEDIVEAKVQRALREYAACLQADVWPAYAKNVHYQEPSAWALNQHMAEMEGEG